MAIAAVRSASVDSSSHAVLCRLDGTSCSGPVARCKPRSDLLPGHSAGGTDARLEGSGPDPRHVHRCRNLPVHSGAHVSAASCMAHGRRPQYRHHRRVAAPGTGACDRERAAANSVRRTPASGRKHATSRRRGSDRPCQGSIIWTRHLAGCPSRPVRTGPGRAAGDERPQPPPFWWRHFPTTVPPPRGWS